MINPTKKPRTLGRGDSLMQFKKKSLEIPEYSYERLLSYSYWLLGQRDYAPSQILKKLATKSTDIEKNQKVINFLIERNYLNEAKFIENYFLKNRKKESLSKTLLRLKQLEVDLNLAKEIMNNLKENEEKNDDSINYPLELLIKKFKVYNPDDYKKYMQNLSYKGFNWEVIKKTIDEFKNLS